MNGSFGLACERYGVGVLDMGSYVSASLFDVLASALHHLARR